MASPKVNKVPYDFASLELSFDLVGAGPLSIIDAFTEVNYSDNVEREKLRGASRIALDHTEGEYDAEGNITFHRYAFDYINAKAAEFDLGFYDMELTMVVNYRRRGAVLQTDTITRVRFGSRENSHSQGPAGLVVPCDLFIGDRIYFNGQGPFAGDRL
jgi:hypothetical protein